VDGYIKLYRKSIENGWLKDPELWTVWCWCLMKATHKPIKTILGLQEISLEPGQFIYGRKKASKELGMPEKVLRNRMLFLEKAQNTAIKRASKFSIISIINWNIYQSDEFEKGHQKGQQGASKGPHTRTKEQKNNTYTLDFNAFYAAYPKKRDPDRAWKAWQKRNGDRPDIAVLLEAIKKQSESLDWKKSGGQFIPYPASWLNAGGWNNEVDVEEQSGFVSIQR